MIGEVRMLIKYIGFIKNKYYAFIKYMLSYKIFSVSTIYIFIKTKCKKRSFIGKKTKLVCSSQDYSIRRR